MAKRTRTSRKLNKGTRTRTRSVKSKRPKTQKKRREKWVTAIDAAQKELSRSGSLDKARTALRLQAYQNARKLFGSISEKM